MATTDRLLYISSDGLVRQLGFDPTAADLGGAAGVASSTHSATSKTTPVDADELPMVDSADSWSLKKLTWANLKATLKTYFDTLYLGISATAANASELLGGTWTSPGAIGSTTPNSGAFTTLSATGNATIGDAEATDTHAIKGATTVLANSANPALKITQTGSGNAFVVEDSASTDSTPFVIDANGRVVAGHTASVAVLGVDAGIQNWGSFGYTSQGRFTADQFGSVLSLVKSRNAAVGGQTVVQNGDEVGILTFLGSDGTGFIRSAQITASVDGTPGTNDMPGRLVFSTTADGASSPTERMRIDSSGNVGIGAAPTYDLDISKTKTGAALVSRVYNAGTGAGSDASLRVVQGTVSGTISAQGDSVLYIGASSNHPVVLLQNSVEVLRISTAKEVLVTNPAGLGYGTGAGGTVTQATSKSTAVTLNKPTGRVTTTADALAAGATATFLVNNSLMTTSDSVVLATQAGGVSGANYNYWVAAIVAGGFYVCLKNISAGSLSEAVAINFSVIKGATT